jgi:hypothetical protein
MLRKHIELGVPLARLPVEAPSEYPLLHWQDASGTPNKVLRERCDFCFCCEPRGAPLKRCKSRGAATGLKSISLGDFRVKTAADSCQSDATFAFFGVVSWNAKVAKSLALASRRATCKVNLKSVWRLLTPAS